MYDAIFVNASNDICAMGHNLDKLTTPSISVLLNKTPQFEILLFACDPYNIVCV